MDAIYKIASTGRIQAPETELAVQLTELKSETEEQGLYWKQPLELAGSQCSRKSCSVRTPKDISCYRREREQALQRTLQVAKSKPLAMQANVMQRELESCLRREYTPENLPLLLLQHYTERIGQLALSKYLHTLRWKRLCQHSKIMEQLYPLYKKQVAYIMQEHSDALQRADRLSVAQEKFLMGKNNPPTLVTQEDLTIYTKWLVCHLHSLKTIHHYLQTLQYLPISSVLTVAVDGVSEVGQENEKVHVNDTSPDIQGSASPGHVDANISESMRTEAAFVLPQHMTETELKPQLRLLLLRFTILYDVEELRAAAKEIELFALRISLGILNYFRSVERTLTINTSGLTLVAGSLVPTIEESSWVNMAKGGLGTLQGLGAHHYVHGTPAEHKVRSTQFTEFSTLEDQDDYYSMDGGCVHTQDQQGVRVMYDGALSDLEDLEAELQLVASHYIEKEKGHQEGSESSPGRVWEWAHAGVDRFAVPYDVDLGSST
uniref:DUF4549 domain-containing protein n=1 Tax=Molossus molossus TaxID=27622 RepID=A0A7J8GRV8_MOLMO|nr:hypothetical protein HJG59_011318 [Molossus molossus]